MTTTVDTSIEVNLPVRTVYNQWTQFAEFPHFMGGVESVTQLGDDRMHWVAEIAGIRREWDARVLEQVPDQRVAWAAVEGATNAGAVTFEDLGGRTRVNLFLEYEPEGVVEKIGDKLDVVERQAKNDLERFKAFVEAEGYATGAWRGTVAGEGHVGTPGVERAAASRGDDGKAGVTGKAVATGVGIAAAAAAVAAGAAAASAKKSAAEAEAAVPVTPPVHEPVTTSFDATEAPATPVASVDPLDPTPLPPGTAGVRTDGMDEPTGAGRSDV
ncbi:Polyketide cyclase / dehydrase and lipid transport [Friedmanniella luteola]|uniref:Polyketide cyclase / dehydrase and lipid transport n=1 Tax=Friedmanniella luteola TaxID=546871 RepID=A0A1H1YKL4_9ACTN|nr:SRPBCC family protein [Friedmanniella luteola]SDT21952.1 Polyketide cyclase / dehydrase and lipid transport [Friedmanniella luteola]